MFGYIKPDKENLYVKELTLYKAVYCGLCETIKKNVSFILPFKLSYDFVFLLMVRATLTGEKSSIKKGRCKYNPFKSVMYAINPESSLFAARLALILTALNLEDDLKDKDTSIFKKIFTYPLSFYFKKKLKKNGEYSDLVNNIRFKLSQMSLLEKEKCSDIDKMCELFGDIMSESLSFSLASKEEKIARQIGSSIGKFIYLTDAIDDAKSDEKKHSYNPLIEKYGSYKDIYKNINEIDIVLSMYTKDALLAFNLLEKNEYTSIINNVLTLGLGKESYRIMTKMGEKND